MNQTWRVSLYLLRKRTKLHRSTLHIPKGTVLEDLPNARDLPFRHQAFIVRNKANAPSWVQNLSKHFDTRDLENQTSSFVLLFEACERLWAISHGNGFHLIPPSIVEPRFGIRVVANSIDPQAIKSIDTRTTDIISRTIRAQISQGSPISELGVAVDRELTQYLAGVPLTGDDAKSWAKRIAGSDSLQLNVIWNLEDIADYAAVLLEQFEATRYKESFGFIDNYRPLPSGDPIVADLDNQLETLIANRETTGVSLAVPSVLEEESFDHFAISMGRKSEDIVELYLPIVYEVLDKWGVSDDEALARVKIRIVDDNGEIKNSRQELKRYITAEASHEGSAYLLLAGEWFAVENDYAKQVDAEIRQIVSRSRRHSLPTWPLGMTESNYNQLAARRRQWTNIDRRMVHYGGPNQKNEFGDLWNPYSRSIVHVKKMSRSASLSHLWAQGTVAMELYWRDPNYRTEVHDRISELPPDLSDVKLIYAVATPKTGALEDELFFFSKVRFLQSLSELRRLRCDVRLVKIQMK